MLTASTRSLNAALSYLGRCPKCMRQSFLFMLGAWGVVLAAVLVTNSLLPIIAATTLAVAATGLWLAHLTAFALGKASSPSISKGEQIERKLATELVAAQRRQFISSFAKVFVLAAAATALSAQSAFAQNHLSDCLTCCAAKLNACGSDGKCNTLYQNCVSSCNSQGETPSDWRCW
jgi:hypothetical protein